MTASRRLILTIALLVLFSMFFVGGPNAYSSRSFEAVWNLGHVFFFVLFTVLLLKRGNPEAGFTMDCIVAVLASTAVGLMVEWVQTGFGRSADLNDLIKNTVGVMVALSFILPSRKTLKKGVLIAFQIITLIAFGFQTFPVLIAWTDEIIARRQFPVLSSFETPFESHRWEGKNMVIDKQISLSGKASMRVNFGVDSTTGVKLRHFPRNWSGYEYLQFSVFNPVEHPTSIVCRIKDRKNKSADSGVNDGFNRHYALNHGWNTITIKLDSLVTSPEGRPMELDRVFGIRLYPTDSSDSVAIYVDDVQLLK
jgi:VanZ family protein